MDILVFHSPKQHFFSHILIYFIFDAFSLVVQSIGRSVGRSVGRRLQFYGWRVLSIDGFSGSVLFCAKHIKFGFDDFKRKKNDFLLFSTCVYLQFFCCRFSLVLVVAVVVVI